MMFFKDFLILMDNRNLWEMANLQTSLTGLKSVVFVSWKANARHGPRIKVSNIAGRMHPDDNFTVTVENEPRVIGKCKLKQQDLENVIDWVKLNKNHLMDVWKNGDEMNPTEVQDGFIKL
jgi:hypothetical protein